MAYLNRRTLRSFETHSDDLLTTGWTIVPAECIGDDVRETLQLFGKIVPQFHGGHTFEVTFQPGYDDLPYSQSKNGIGPHTEAPVFDPPPRYLALHCHTQAKCGGGYTSLADGHDFLESLDPALREWIETAEIVFGATADPSAPGRQVRRSRILETHDGHTIFRFSFNQFNYGDVNPSRETLRLASSEREITPLIEISAKAENYFHEHATQILIPSGNLLVWDNWRLMHARSQFKDPSRHLTRYWLK